MFTFGPTVSVWLAAAASIMLSSNNPISGIEPCQFMDVDVAGPVLVAMMFGFLGLVTLPVGTILLGMWFVAAVIVTLVWGLRRRAEANG